MLSAKQEFFLQFIEDYYKKNNRFPNLNDIKKNSNYNSYNNIHRYLQKLEELNYLKYDKEKKEITYLNGYSKKEDIYAIPFINKNGYIKINNNKLNFSEKYIAMEIKNNLLRKQGINYKDILIIKKSNTYLNNKYVLVNYDNEYNIFKYQKKDGFIHLSNDKTIIPITNNNVIIGKVVLLIRELF